MFASIADSHNISLDEVRRARTQLDHRGFDWLVNVPMALFTVAGAVEVIRIGNDHLGHRGLRIPWGKHRGMTFALVVVTMWVIAAMPALRTHLRHPRHRRHPGTSP